MSENPHSYSSFAPESLAADRSGTGAARTGYRPEIDGLRAVAVLAVLAYHAGIAAAPGGFVGVDVFFVISGYLIMATLTADIRQGRFSVLAFYERRIRRIFPALSVMAAFCLLMAALIFPPDAFARLGWSLGAMAVFASNFLFCADSAPAGYFAMSSEGQLLLHSWSLAVEEQFYILLPLGLSLLRHRRERVMIAWILGVTAISFALNVWLVIAWRAGSFYLVPPRAWELLLGSLLALGVVPSLKTRVLREAGALLGLALILIAAFGFTKYTRFPGLAALVPCLGAGLILHATAGSTTLTGQLLTARPLTSIGLISYSLYLWHWPIIVLVRYVNTGKLDAKLTTIVILSSLAAGVLSWRFVERPFRDRRALPARRQLLAGGAGASLAAVLTGAVIVAGQGLPWRFDPATRALIAANLAREADHAVGDCQNWQRDVRRLSDISFCRIGRDEPRHILFWGDSHVGGMMPLVRRLYARRCKTARAVAGCSDGTWRNGKARCDRRRRLADRRRPADRTGSERLTHYGMVPDGAAR